MTNLSKASNCLCISSYVLHLFIAMHIKTCIDLCGLPCSVVNVSGGHQSHKQKYSAALSFPGLRPLQLLLFVV